MTQPLRLCVNAPTVPQHRSPPTFAGTRGVFLSVPPLGVAFRDCATVGSFDEFLVGVDDLGWGFAFVPFSSVGSTVVVVGEVVVKIAAESGD